MNQVKAHDPRRFLVACGLIGLLMLAALASQVHSQWTRVGLTLYLADNAGKLERSEKRPAVRGMILSSDGAVLAENDNRSTLLLQGNKIPKGDAFFLDLGEAAGISPGEMANRLRKDKGLNKDGSLKSYSVSWSRPLDEDAVAAIAQVRRDWRADGVSVESKKARRYGLGPAAANLVGWIQNGTPLNGVERARNDVLRGVDGELHGLVDRSGEFLPLKLSKNSREAVNGEDVVLTIDSDIQKAAYEALEEAVTTHAAEYGVAVVMEPATGNVLAMSEYPAPVPPGQSDIPAQFDLGQERNRAISLPIEPGSVLKTVTLAEALDLGLVGLHDEWSCKGKFRVLNQTLGCHGGHGRVDPEKAIAKSCNYAAANWARLIGYEKYSKFIESTGMLDRVDLELEGERKGFYNRGVSARELTLANLGYGQSIQVTPLALCSALTMFANRGLAMTPRLIEYVGEKKQPLRPRGILIKEETADAMLRLMESVIQTDEGTGNSLRIPGYRLAGKTGTAERIGTGGGYVANFAGYVPANSPQAVVLVMVNAPTKGHMGGSVAGPVFRKIALSVIKKKQIPPTEPIQPKEPAL
ncbi:MAG: peptidoglycan D,D-transpeptidase FtsI family protein [Fimbriimonas sp.]